MTPRGAQFCCCFLPSTSPTLHKQLTKGKRSRSAPGESSRICMAGPARGTSCSSRSEADPAIPLPFSFLNHIHLSLSPERKQPGGRATPWMSSNSTSWHAPRSLWQDRWPAQGSQTLRIKHFGISAETTLPLLLICALYLWTSVKLRFSSLPNFPKMLKFLINRKGFLLLTTFQL